VFLPDEVVASPEITRLLDARKQERRASYREIQSTFAMIKCLTGSWRTVLEMPLTVMVRNVMRNEARVTDTTTSPGTTIVTIVNFIDGTEERILPPPEEWPKRFPCLVEGMDQGSIGRGKAFFLASRRRETDNGYTFSYLPVWCFIHRLIRDLKHVQKYAAGGQYLRAVLQLAFIFSLVYGPSELHKWVCARGC